VLPHIKTELVEWAVNTEDGQRFMDIMEAHKMALERRITVRLFCALSADLLTLSQGLSKKRVLEADDKEEGEQGVEAAQVEAELTDRPKSA
jgi:hypothetical protein